MPKPGRNPRVLLAENDEMNPAAGMGRTSYRKNQAGSGLSEADLKEVLAKMGTDYTFFADLLIRFEKSSAELITAIQSAIADRDEETTAKLLHILKGEVSIFNAHRALEMLQEARDAGAAPRSRKIIKQVEGEIRQVIKQCQEFIDANNAI